MQRLPAQYSGYGAFNVPPRAPTAGRGVTVPDAPPRAPTAGRSAVVPTSPSVPMVKDQSRVPQERQNPFAANASEGLPPGYAERYGLGQPASAVAPAGPSGGLGGPIGALVRGGGLLSSMANGDVDIGAPIRNSLDAMGSAVRTYDEEMPKSGFGRAMGETVFNSTYGPQIREALADAIRAGQSYLDPGSYTPRSSDREAPPAGEDEYRGTGYTDQPNARQASSVAPISGFNRARYLEGTGGGNQDFIIPRASLAQGSGGGGSRPSAPSAPDPVAPVNYDPYAYYQNVMTREEALRRLLGKEWYE